MCTLCSHNYVTKPQLVVYVIQLQMGVYVTKSQMGVYVTKSQLDMYIIRSQLVVYVIIIGHVSHKSQLRVYGSDSCVCKLPSHN